MENDVISLIRTSIVGARFGQVRQDCSVSTSSQKLEGSVGRPKLSVSRIFICKLLFLAVSNRKGQPIGIKAKGSILTAALRKARLREQLPSQMSSHTLADAPESFIVYAWLNDCIGLEESAEIVTKEKDPICGQTKLLAVIRERITFA
jgi:hypothetical protein